MDHLQGELDRIMSLPEVDAGTMTQAFAARYGLDARTVLAGNGSTQLIYLLPAVMEWESVAIAGPTYADYADACRLRAVTPTLVPALREEGFQPNLDALSAAADRAEALFICNPNNPTGALLEREHLMALCAAHPDTQIIVDESYLPFVPGSEGQSLLGSGLSNLLVLNSMSKIFRLPGLRIGFVHGTEATIGRLRQQMLPWSVNALAQSAVIYLMTRREEIERFVSGSCRRLNAARRAFYEATDSIRGLETFPSCTSFILMRLSGGWSAPEMWEAMADAHILIRDCANFEGLSDRYIRISLKEEAANQRAAELLNLILAVDGGRP
jgi:threonine-phosphate decarboxylase